jgi:hypothetical protein
VQPGLLMNERLELYLDSSSSESEWDTEPESEEEEALEAYGAVGGVAVEVEQIGS